MSQIVKFGGAALIRPGGATKIEVGEFRRAQLSGTGTVCIVGNADGGAPRTVTRHLSAESVLAKYRSGDIVDAASILSNPGNDPRVPGGATEIVVYKVNNSTQSSLSVNGTTAATKACVTSTQAGPYAMSPGDILDFTTNTGNVTYTVAGTNAVVEGSAAITSWPTSGQVLAIQVNGATNSTVQIITFGSGITNISQLVNAINTQVTGGVFARENASVSDKLDLVSTQYGTGSYIEIDPDMGGGTYLSTAGLLTNLKLTQGQNDSGSGDAINLGAMTVAELKVKIDALGGIELDNSVSPPKYCSTLPGSASSITVNASTPPGLNSVIGLTSGTSATGSDAAVAASGTFTSIDYGIHNNNIAVTLTDPAPTSSTRVVTIERTLDGKTVTETSPTLGSKVQFNVSYTGSQPTATCTINSTGLTTTTGLPADNLSLTFADYPKLADLVNAINAHSNYTAATVQTNAATFNSADLDYPNAVNVKSPANPAFYARNWELQNWVNNNSSLVTFSRDSAGVGIPDALAKTSLTGATKGTSSTSDWTGAALLALKNERINSIVPLVSEDNTANGNNYDFSDIVAAYLADTKALNSASPNQNERYMYVGMKGNKAALIAQANAMNSEFATLCADRQKLPSGLKGTLTFLPEWSTACILAGMRGAAEIGEPLTKKIVLTQGIERDWDPTAVDEIEELILEGVTLVLKDPSTQQFKIEKCITTYTGEDNLLLMEESMQTGILSLAYSLRSQMIARFIGTKATLTNALQIVAFAETVFQLYGPRERGGVDFLIDSQDDAGNPLSPWRDLKLEIGGTTYASDVVQFTATLTLVNGINFILNTLIPTPANISIP